MPMKPLPSELARAQKSILAAIESAFGGVTRDGGVSWSEAEALDHYAPPAECEAARALDRESRWQDLIEDPEWPGYDSPSTWGFLDPIGYRYYVAVALTRVVMLRPTVQVDTGIGLRLSRMCLDQLVELDAQQIHVLERAARFMIAIGRRRQIEWQVNEWREVLKMVEELRKPVEDRNWERKWFDD
jgi:hypothetical protein